MVGHLDSEELTARLRILREILRRNIEGRTTAMFMGLLISLAFRSAASMTLRASSSVSIYVLSKEEECNHHSKSGLHVSR
jgi:hypothetical protein